MLINKGFSGFCLGFVIIFPSIFPSILFKIPSFFTGILAKSLIYKLFSSCRASFFSPQDSHQFTGIPMKRNKLDNLEPFKPMGDEPLARRPICVKLPNELDKAIRSLPDTSAWIRSVLEAAAREKGIYPSRPSPEEE